MNERTFRLFRRKHSDDDEDNHFTGKCILKLSLWDMSKSMHNV
jgi:hypothetical protein